MAKGKSKKARCLPYKNKNGTKYCAKKGTRVRFCRCPKGKK